MTSQTAKSPNQQGIIKTAAASTPVKKQPATLKGWLKNYEKEIARALPAQVSPERFNRICMTALTGNKNLQQCTPESFMGAILNSAQLGVEPNTPLGQAYLIPYRNHGKLECQFQLGYKGLIQLARRSGEISIIKAQTVYENDEFDYELGLDPKIKHIPSKGKRGRAIAYYAFFKTRSGDFDFEVAYRDEMEEFAKRYSKSFSQGPWQSNFDEMAKKTLIKKVLKYAPLSTELATQIASDNTIKRADKGTDADLSDMSMVPDTDYLDAEYEESELEVQTDPVTGEVHE